MRSAKRSPLSNVPGSVQIDEKILAFLRELPKVELHAHLNGCLNINSIRELAATVYGKETDEFLMLSKRFLTFKKGANLDDCFEKFSFVHDLTASKVGLQRATELVIRDFAKDNVIYLELRTTPKSNANMSRRDYLQTVLECISRARSRYSMKVKLLPSINRGEPVSVSEETVALSVDFCKLYPDIIVGIDFSGNPNKGNFEEFMPALTLARKHGLMLAIHCAEIPNRSEIKQMLMFGMSRCGHGTYLTSADYAYMKQHNIAVECCLTSNIKSGTVESLQYHHIKRLIEAEVPRVLCTDDSGVFDTTLSNEFYLATEAFGLTQTQCIDLTMEAIDHAFASCEEKQNLKIQLDAFISQMTVKDNRVHKTKRYIEKKTCE